MEENARSVKLYYVAGELYDWVTDPKALERIFHRSRAWMTDKVVRRTGGSDVAIDIGCGTGLITRSIVARTLVGVDINRWNLDRAKRRIPGADFIQCDVDHLPFRDETADLGVCTEILEHLSHPSRTLREIARVMSSKARLVGSVPSRSPLWKMRNILSITHPKSEPFHNNFSKRQFATLLSGSFTAVKVFYCNFSMNVFFIASGPIEQNELNA